VCEVFPEISVRQLVRLADHDAHPAELAIWRAESPDVSVRAAVERLENCQAGRVALIGRPAAGDG